MIWTSSKQPERPRAGKAQKRETNLATMMIVIVSVFTICNLYQGMFWILKYYDLVSDLTILYLDSFSDFLEVFTSSTNVLIYVKFLDYFAKIQGKSNAVINWNIGFIFQNTKFGSIS